MEKRDETEAEAWARMMTAIDKTEAESLAKTRSDS